MKLKHLLTLGALALCSTAVWAQTEISVSATAPTVLPYASSATEGSSFTQKNTNKVGATMTYSLNVEEAGNYNLYLFVGDKRSPGMGFTVSVGETVMKTVNDATEYGGNWNVFINDLTELTLQTGTNSLVITSTSERWNMDEDHAPIIVPAGYVQNLTTSDENPVALDLFTYSESTTIPVFTTFAAYGWDNHAWGSSNSVLISSWNSGKTGGQTWSPIYKNQNCYTVEITTTGTYPLNASGVLIPDQNWSGSNFSNFTQTEIADYSLTVTATPEGGDGEGVTTSLTFPTVDVSSFGSGTYQSGVLTAEGSIYLAAGTYTITLSSDYAQQALLSLQSLSFGVPELPKPEYYLANSMTGDNTGEFTANPSYKFQPTNEENTYTLTVGNVSSSVEFFILQVKDGETTAYSDDGYTEMKPVESVAVLEAENEAKMTLDNNYVNVTFTLTLSDGAPYSLSYNGTVNGDAWTISPGNDQTMQSGTVSGNTIELATATDGALVYIYVPSTAGDNIYYTLTAEKIEPAENDPETYAEEELEPVKADLQTELVGNNTTTTFFTVGVQKGYKGVINVYTSEDTSANAAASFNYSVFPTAVPTGVEVIESAEVEAAYYSLQGVKVTNPGNGIFIKVQNGKASKVIIQ